MHAALPAAVLLMLSLSAPAIAQDFRTYVDERFGTSVRVPAGWTSKPIQPTGAREGRLFLSPDGESLLAIYSTRISSPDMAHAADEATAPNEQVTYRAQGGSWFVRSGFKNGDRIFYRKAVFSCGGRVAHLLAFEYPAAEKRAHDRLVTVTANSLRAGRGSEGC